MRKSVQQFMNFFRCGAFSTYIRRWITIHYVGFTKKWFIRLFVGNELIISKYIMFLRSSIQNSTQGGKLKKKNQRDFFSFSVFKLYLTKTKMTFLNSILYLCFFSMPVMILLYSCNFYYDLNLAEFFTIMSIALAHILCAKMTCILIFQ